MGLHFIYSTSKINEINSFIVKHISLNISKFCNNLLSLYFIFAKYEFYDKHDKFICDYHECIIEKAWNIKTIIRFWRFLFLKCCVSIFIRDFLLEK